MNRPKFVIGIGSQRAGSTLLHRILDECTDIFMHPVKELHYFDTLYNVRHPSILTKYSQRQLNRELERLIKADNHSYINDKQYKCYLRTNKILANNIITDVDYLDLYRPCILGSRVVGEITPEYMILPDEGVKLMAEMLGDDTPIILITRNPVDRFISAFKLLKLYGSDNVDMSNFERDLNSVFDEMPDWIKQQKKLNDYQSAILLYSKYFNNVICLSYEELVNDADKVISVLEDKLSVNIDKDKCKKILGVKVNQIGDTSSISQETYEFVARQLEKV